MLHVGGYIVATELQRVYETHESETALNTSNSFVLLEDGSEEEAGPSLTKVWLFFRIEVRRSENWEFAAVQYMEWSPLRDNVGKCPEMCKPGIRP